jgi:hypothetical protein
MSQTFYLSRTLFNDNQSYTEEELLAVSSYIIILAEPGAGKTELLSSLARQLGTKKTTASVFSYLGANSIGSPLVIDAFDELAKVDKTGIHKLLVNVANAKPTCLIVSSRSSEWDSSATNTFEQFIGHKPTVVRLCEFNESEQREIYHHHTKLNSFDEFRSEVTRFSLEPLLPNPQFLKLFADGYVESNGHFPDKRSIFTLAIKSLAREVNASNNASEALSSSQKIELASEVFAKLLLAGVEGVGINEVNENRMFPFIGSLISNDRSVSSILSTRLFKPGDNPDQHRPVHKIVSEYCAADYLTKRISSPSDSLTMDHCLAVIAPNSTVRDELRGLLGWMASLGFKEVEEAAIKVDPYAVLANGDPSQLTSSSKGKLLSRLKDIEAKDPYFRRSDSWRRFSVAGFFTPEVINEIRPIIQAGSDGDLRDLLLELLVDTGAVYLLIDELRAVLLSSSENMQTRMLAINCLLSSQCYKPRLDLSCLIDEASNSSLHLASKIIETLGPETFTVEDLETFLRNCANLYPSKEQYMSRTLASRYFVKRFISHLKESQTESLLDTLSNGLTCDCKKSAYECECRAGISKVIGSLLDNYFELVNPSYDPIQVWNWVKNLNFTGQRNTQDIKSVKVLHEDITLRQRIIAHVFGDLTDRELIFDTRIHTFGGHYSHAGLGLSLADYRFIVDLAFERNNTQLWASFLSQHSHNYFLNKKALDILRKQMRKQANEKPEFMSRWALQSRQLSNQAKHEDRKWNAKHRRSMRRRDIRKLQINAENINYIQENRKLIEEGKHFGYLERFAYLVLDNPEEIEADFGDEVLVRTSLRNCLEFIEPIIPNLKKLAELQCESKYLLAETVLYAACIEIIRDTGNLEEVNPSLLFALRTNLNISNKAVSQEEVNSIKSEIDRLLFPNVEAAEKFLREYVEPQLSIPTCAHPEVGLLKHDHIFSPLQEKLSIDWLIRFEDITYYTLDILFEIAAQFGNRQDLNRIILMRCSQLLQDKPALIDDEVFEQRQKFWFIRAFYFLSIEQAEPYWNYLKLEKSSIFLFDKRSSRMNRNDHPNWPNLTSNNILAIMQAFFSDWPKVELPNQWGTGSPSGEKAYRFLTGIIWQIGSDGPDDALPVLSTLLADPLYIDMHSSLKSIQAEQLRKMALRDFEPPSSQQICELLDGNAIVTVEGLRQLIISELKNYQKDIDGGEFNAANRFYRLNKKSGDERLGEVESVEIIAERLSLRLHPQNIIITSEHQTQNQNRIDITAAKIIDGKRRLLVIEAKGQWHPELYTAASTQLYERYSIHPDAEQQGIYLVIWFGPHEKVANKKGHKITNAKELKESIETKIPPDIKGFIDVFILDISKEKH